MTIMLTTRDRSSPRAYWITLHPLHKMKYHIDGSSAWSDLFEPVSQTITTPKLASSMNIKDDLERAFFLVLGKSKRDWTSCLRNSLERNNRYLQGFLTASYLYEGLTQALTRKYPDFAEFFGGRKRSRLMCITENNSKRINFLALDFISFNGMPGSSMNVGISSRWIEKRPSSSGQLMCGPEYLFFGEPFLPYYRPLLNTNEISIVNPCTLVSDINYRAAKRTNVEGLKARLKKQNKTLFENMLKSIKHCLDISYNVHSMGLSAVIGYHLGHSTSPDLEMWSSLHKGYGIIYGKDIPQFRRK